jgi:hypothetical protein
MRVDDMPVGDMTDSALTGRDMTGRRVPNAGAPGSELADTGSMLGGPGDAPAAAGTTAESPAPA